MQISPSANIDAMTKLADKSGEVQMQVGVSVIKDTLDATAANVMTLLESMQPHLGKHVDIRL